MTKLEVVGYLCLYTVQSEYSYIFFLCSGFEVEGIIKWNWEEMVDGVMFGRQVSGWRASLGISVSSCLSRISSDSLELG